MLSCAAFAAAPALASEHEPAGASRQIKPWSQLSPTRGWSGSAGVGLAAVPKYAGADRYRVLALPMLTLQWEHRLDISPIGGMRLDLRPGEALSFGPTLQYARGRRSRGELSDLPGTGGGFVAGIFAGYRTGPLTLNGDVVRAVSGELEGYRAQLRLGLGAMPVPGLLLALGPSLSWTSAGWTDAYFGISEAGAARSGLPRYRAGAGVTDVRINVHASYFLSAKAAITVIGAWGRLCNDAADSPIVTERGRPQQAFLGAMLTHRF